MQGTVRIEEWPLKVPFVIARSSRTHVSVVCVELRDGAHVGRGECQPNSRYHETPEAVRAELTQFFTCNHTAGFDAVARLSSMAARNALDCALWDLKAKKAGTRVWDLMGSAAPAPFRTVYTLSLGAPDAMASAAREAWGEGKTHLKLKLGGEGDDDRVRAVRRMVPDATLVADANEAWTPALLKSCMPVMAGEGIALLEQPLPAGQDAVLADMESPVPLCADESCHGAADVPALVGKYDVVNIKLDKAGGLTPALALEKAATDAGLDVMVGCMLGTSLAMAPAALIAARARFADLDGPLLLARDRDHKITFDETYRLAPFGADLWG